MLNSLTPQRAALLIFAAAFATIAGAWGSQIFGGLVPCELCLEQRLPYYWGLPVLALVLLAWSRLPRLAWYIGLAVAALLFVWGTYLATYHAGVEWGFWPGPTECTGSAVDFGAPGNLLENLKTAKVVRCDEVQWSFLGLSLAGYNALISALMAALAGWGLLGLGPRRPA